MTHRLTPNRFNGGVRVGGTGTADELFLTANGVSVEDGSRPTTLTISNNRANALTVDIIGDLLVNGAEVAGQLVVNNQVVTGTHADLDGLGDDDHTQYIRVDGTRAFSGNQSFGMNDITSVRNVSVGNGSGSASVELNTNGATDNPVVTFKRSGVTVGSLSSVPGAISLINGSNEGVVITDAGGVQIDSGSGGVRIPANQSQWISMAYSAATPTVGNAVLEEGPGKTHEAGGVSDFTVTTDTAANIVGRWFSAAGEWFRCHLSNTSATYFMSIAAGTGVTLREPNNTRYAAGSSVDLIVRAVNVGGGTEAVTITVLATKSTMPQLTPETTGMLTYYDGTQWDGLYVGSAGQVLSVAGGIPTWATLDFSPYVRADGTVPMGANLNLAGFALNNVDGFAATNGVAGDTIYHNGTQFVHLAKGTDSQVLTLAAGVPTWATPAVGGGGTVQDGVSLAIQATDEGTVAGNPRGNASVDLQLLRSVNTMVASGQSSVLIGGSHCTASGTASFAYTAENCSSSAPGSGFMGSLDSSMTSTVSTNYWNVGIAARSCIVTTCQETAICGGETCLLTNTRLCGILGSDNCDMSSNVVVGVRQCATVGSANSDFVATGAAATGYLENCAMVATDGCNIHRTNTTGGDNTRRCAIIGSSSSDIAVTGNDTPTTSAVIIASARSEIQRGANRACIIAGGNTAIIGEADYSCIIGQAGSIANNDHNSIVLCASATATAPVNEGMIVARATSDGSTKPCYYFYTSTASVGVSLDYGDTTWAAISDVNKKNLQGEVNYADALAKFRTLPIYNYTYKDEDNPRLYTGPTAQDFHARWSTSGNQLKLNTLELDAATMSALRGLIAEVDVLKAQVALLSQ